MIVVLDTNVMIAALVAEGLCREVVHRAVRARTLASSVPLLDELDSDLLDEPLPTDFLSPGVNTLGAILSSSSRDGLGPCSVHRSWNC